MDNPLFAIITDIHLDNHNCDEVKLVVIEAIDLAKSKGLSTVFVGGDVFNSRKNQTFKVLQTWLHILDYAKAMYMELIVIPGNHDKLDYTSKESYLDVFTSHSAMTLIDQCDEYDVCLGVRVHLIPFFDEKSAYTPELNKINLLKDGKNFLITHIAVNGVKNNDGSEVDQGIGINLFNQFDQVFVGHYHNRQRISDKIIYIGSIMQKNYGEDDRKGITFVDQNGDDELVELTFIKYQTVKIDLDDMQDISEMDKIVAGFSQTAQTNNVRFKITGSKDKIDGLNKSKFAEFNIDIKCEYKDIDIDMSYQQAENFTAFNKKSILDEFDVFSDEQQIDKKIGTDYLQKAL